MKPMCFGFIITFNRNSIGSIEKWNPNQTIGSDIGFNES